MKKEFDPFIKFLKKELKRLKRDYLTQEEVMNSLLDNRLEVEDDQMDDLLSLLMELGILKNELDFGDNDDVDFDYLQNEVGKSKKKSTSKEIDFDEDDFEKSSNLDDIDDAEITEDIDSEDDEDFIDEDLEGLGDW
ncbi:Uncharacterised protein, partial [Mycoplasmopsis edwardii]